MKPKTIPISYAVSGWKLKKNSMTDYRLVTPENRKQAVIIGRILYVITDLVFRGTMTVTPCFDSGWYFIPWMPWMGEGHYTVFFNEPTNRDDWISSNKALLDLHINEQSLYIKPTDPILTYKKQDK
jgi:hypothetical protein